MYENFYSHFDLNDELPTLLQKHIRALVQAQNDSIESDLLKVLGARAELPPEEIRALGIVVAWQRQREYGAEVYRGIMENGEWVIDHMPQLREKK